MGLNPDAAVYVPQQALGAAYSPYSYMDVADEDSLTTDELEELEACEQWVQLMSDLAESEREHLISLALSQAPAEQIQAVEARHVEDDGGAKPKGGAGGKHRKAPRKVAH